MFSDVLWLFPVVIDATFVLELTLAIEDEAVWGAECAKRLRDRLRFIDAVREGECLFIVSFFHRHE